MKAFGTGQFLILAVWTHFSRHQKSVGVLYLAWCEIMSFIFSVLSLVSLQATGVREDQLLVTVLPGLPTAAEFFLLPDKQLNEGKPEKNSAYLDQVRQQLLFYVCKYLQHLCRWMHFTLLF